MLLDEAFVGGADEGGVEFFWEDGRDLNLKLNVINHVRFVWVGVDALNDADILGGEISFFAEVEDIISCAGPNGGEEGSEWGGGRIKAAVLERLVGFDCVWAEVGVYTAATGEIYDEFHNFLFIPFYESPPAELAPAGGFEEM